MRIAIVGSGVAGLVAAHCLHREHDVTVYEAGDHVGGHVHTHTVRLDGEQHEIDTGFIVFNDRTYPNFVALLAELGVESQPSLMSFSVSNESSGLEYNGTSLNGLFAQRRNLLRPAFHRMLRDILRFNREAPALLDDEREVELGACLADGAYSREFVGDYLLPMGSAIWSTDPTQMLRFPARLFVRFLHNHGMLSIDDRPQWRVIRGGSARYVDKLSAPFGDRIRLRAPVRQVRRTPSAVHVAAAGGSERYDQVFLACHSDQALALLADASPLEREVLGAIRYQHNQALLHTDASLLPRSRRAWAAWNYHVRRDANQRVALTYNMNILQNLRSKHTFCVTLNPGRAIDPARVIGRYDYHHPLFTPAAASAQQRQREINGAARTYYCGAYWRNGFHEDGVVSALAAVRHLKETTLAQRDLQRMA